MADIMRDDDEIVELDAGTPAHSPADPDVVELDAAEGSARLPARAVLHEDGSVELPLLYPVALKFKGRDGVREERFASLRFHRLTGADIRAVSEVEGKHIQPVSLARSARMPGSKMNAIYDRMDAADIADADRIVAHFLGAGRRTGG